jgi:hypothetical protein
MNDTQLLAEVAQGLYGAQWQASLSAAISVSDRSMRRWANGTDAIPWGVWFDIYRHLEARALTLDYWKKELYDRVVIRECEQQPFEKFDLGPVRELSLHGEGFWADGVVPLAVEVVAGKVDGIHFGV